MTAWKPLIRDPANLSALGLGINIETTTNQNFLYTWIL